MTTHAITYNVQKALRYRETIANILIGVIICSAVAYVFFVQQAVMNVVSRQNITKEIGVQDASINDLENRYLLLDNSISMAVATQYGFVPAETTAFIPARLLGQAPTLTNEL